MNFGGPEFVLAIIGMAMFAGVMKTAIRARHGLSTHGFPPHHRRGRRDESAGKTAEVEGLKAENARLTDRLEASEDRLAVLERIVTDKSYNLANEIEALRDREPRLEGRDKTV